jgi:hypothetical protein
MLFHHWWVLQQAAARNTKARQILNEDTSAEAAELPRVSFFFWIQQLSKTGIFLEKRKIFVVARVITVGGAKLNGYFQIGHGRVGFAGETIQGRERVVNVVQLGSKLARLLETLPRLVPAAQVHHGNTALVMIFRRFWILLGGRFHSLFNNAQVHAGAICKFLTGALEDLFEFLLGALKLLLMKEGHGLLVDFHLCLHSGVHHFDTATLRHGSR